MSEPGWILIMKPFQVRLTVPCVQSRADLVQRTHVLTHAAGLVMHRILDMPAQGGLGLRRCQWTTTTLNIPSQNAARRLGYTHEGVLRAIKVLAPGKVGARRECTSRYGWKSEGIDRDSWEEG